MGEPPASRGLHALYREDADRADRLLFGRVTHPDRRGFLKGAGLGVMAALVGASIPFHRNIPEHFIPVALAGEAVIRGKDGLVVLNDRPLSAETPAHLLDDAITPRERHFIRNNGIPPASADAAGWTLAIDGLVETPLKLGIDDLRRRFDVVTAALTLECAGNGRAFFDPPADGAQWTYGAVACSEWSGVRLADVLKAAGVKASVVYNRARGRGHAPLRRRRSTPDLARRADREGDGPEHSRRLRPERRADPPHERRAAPPGGPRMAGVVLSEMAHAGPAAGPRPRWGEDDRHLLPRPRPPGRTGGAAGRGGVRYHRGHAGQVAHHSPGHGPPDAVADAGSAGPRLGGRADGRERPALHRLPARPGRRPRSIRR